MTHISQRLSAVLAFALAALLAVGLAPSPSCSSDPDPNLSLDVVFGTNQTFAEGIVQLAAASPVYKQQAIEMVCVWKGRAAQGLPVPDINGDGSSTTIEVSQLAGLEAQLRALD